MDIVLERTIFRPDGIFGIMRDEAGKQICVTAEHSYQKNKPKVPPGTWTCIRYPSGKFHQVVFLLQDVPYIENIEIHPGNWPQIDSDGCILIGDRVVELTNGSICIANSHKTFERFMEKVQADTKTFKLTIL